MKIKKYQKPAGVLPSMVNTQLRNIRQKIADSKWGPRIAQELGIKPKEIELSDGTKTTINGGSSIIGPEMITNPVGSIIKTTKVATKTSPILKILNNLDRKLNIKYIESLYIDAVNKGNLKEAQQLRDLHFKLKAPKTQVKQVVYHGNRTSDKIKKFDKSKIESQHKNIAGIDGFWFIDDPEIAKWEYALTVDSFGKGIENSKFGEVIPAYINIKNPSRAEQLGLNELTLDAKESMFDTIKRAKLMQTRKTDGFILKVIDSDGRKFPYESVQNQFIVKNPKAIKRADAITYDDAGKIIPLSKRDNFNNPDIRYGIIPLTILGLGEASKNKTEKHKQGGILKAQNGIKYTPTNSNIEFPEIEGYKPQFSNFWYGGDETKKEESVPVQEEPIQETPVQVETPVQSEWSDIKSMIKKHEGFTPHAKKSFGEPNPTVGYGFFNVLPDGRKITDNMTLTEDEADRQLDIAIDKLRKNISSAVSSYNMKISDNQLNVLIDLGYHGGAGLVGRLLKEANGDINKIPGLLSRYATTAQYGDTSITPGLKKRAQRRVEGWNKG